MVNLRLAAPASASSDFALSRFGFWYLRKPKILNCEIPERETTDNGMSGKVVVDQQSLDGRSSPVHVGGIGREEPSCRCQQGRPTIALQSHLRNDDRVAIDVKADRQMTRYCKSKRAKHVLRSDGLKIEMSRGRRWSSSAATRR